MAWEDFGWNEMPGELAPRQGESLYDWSARVRTYDAAHPGVLTEVESARLEEFGEHIYNKAIADAPGGVGGSVPDADATTKGKVQLAGDLAGTAASPQIAAGAVGTTELAAGAVTAAKVAADVATQAELDAVAAAKANTSHTHGVADLGTGTPASGKYLDGDNSWKVLPAGSGSGFRTDEAGNLGATHTSTLGTENWLTTVGTLNANHVETIAGRAAGKFVLLRLAQDATGGRTLQISDGTTPTSVTINSAANAVTDILVICKDATDFDVIVLGATGGEPTLAVTGTTGNLGATSTVDFASVAREKWLAGTLNANHAVTVSNPVAGSRLRFIAVQDGTGGRTLTIAGQSVSIPTTATTGLAMVLAVWLDSSTFRIESAGVENDPSAVLKALVDTKGDLIVATSDNTVARQAVGTDGYALVADSTQTNGVKYSHRPQVVTAYRTGTLTVAAGTSRLPIMEGATIVDVRAMVNTAPTGATLIVDVNKNGTTIFTTQGNRPTIAISGTASSAAVPDVTSLAAGDYLTVDVDQIGSTVAGADLVVSVRYRLAA